MMIGRESQYIPPLFRHGTISSATSRRSVFSSLWSLMIRDGRKRGSKSDASDREIQIDDSLRLQS
jgi:hypothetical protein